MSTLGTQPPRRRHDICTNSIEHDVKAFLHVAANLGVALADVIAVAAVAQYARRTDALIDDGDNRDEHAHGIGQALDGIGQALLEISVTLDGIAEFDRP